MRFNLIRSALSWIHRVADTLLHYYYWIQKLKKIWTRPKKIFWRAPDIFFSRFFRFSHFSSILMVPVLYNYMDKTDKKLWSLELYTPCLPPIHLLLATFLASTNTEFKLCSIDSRKSQISKKIINKQNLAKATPTNKNCVTKKNIKVIKKLINFCSKSFGTYFDSDKSS